MTIFYLLHFGRAVAQLGRASESASLSLADGDAVDVHELVSATFSLPSVQCRNRTVASSNLARPTKTALLTTLIWGYESSKINLWRRN